jgi:hypothetical protein
MGECCLFLAIRLKPKQREEIYVRYLPYNSDFVLTILVIIRVLLPLHSPTTTMSSLMPAPEIEPLACCKRQTKTKRKLDCHTATQRCVGVVCDKRVGYSCVACLKRRELRTEFGIYLENPVTASQSWGARPSAAEKEESDRKWLLQPRFADDVMAGKSVAKQDITRAYMDAKVKYETASTEYFKMLQAHVEEKREEFKTQLPLQVDQAKKEACCNMCAKKRKPNLSK